MNGDRLLALIETTEGWDARIAAIRQVPEHFGTAAQQDIYSSIARRLYVPQLAPDFAYVHWREDHELEPFLSAYDDAHRATRGFHEVSANDLKSAILDSPRSLRVFRMILGFTASEFAQATLAVDADHPVSVARIKSIEGGRQPSAEVATRCAEVIERSISRRLFQPSPAAGMRSKTEKPDTAEGWKTVQQYSEKGVPFPVFLHQRLYGGAFRQLLDATSSARGNLVEEAVADLLSSRLVPFLRTGSANQEAVVRRFGLTVKPAPDFVIFDRHEVLRGILECKAANDGGTARDKAARFRALRAESVRLGGVPVVAVLAGLGWTRTADALGPVVRDTDGRVFSLANLPELLSMEPFASLVETQF